MIINGLLLEGRHLLPEMGTVVGGLGTGCKRGTPWQAKSIQLAGHSRLIVSTPLMFRESCATLT